MIPEKERLFCPEELIDKNRFLSGGVIGKEGYFPVRKAFQRNFIQTFSSVGTGIQSAGRGIQSNDSFRTTQQKRKSAILLQKSACIIPKTHPGIPDLCQMKKQNAFTFLKRFRSQGGGKEEAGNLPVLHRQETA